MQLFFCESNCFFGACAQVNNDAVEKLGRACQLLRQELDVFLNSCKWRSLSGSTHTDQWCLDLITITDHSVTDAVTIVADILLFFFPFMPYYQLVLSLCYMERKSGFHILLLAFCYDCVIWSERLDFIHYCCLSITIVLYSMYEWVSYLCHDCAIWSVTVGVIPYYWLCHDYVL